MITSKNYQIEIPEWMWRRWTTIIGDRSEYSRYNDRMVACLARDLRRFDEAGLIDLDDDHRHRVEHILDDLAPEEAILELERVPEESAGHGNGGAGGAAGADSPGDGGDREGGRRDTGELSTVDRGNKRR